MRAAFVLALAAVALAGPARAQGPAPTCEEQVKVWAAYVQDLAADRERAQIQAAAQRVRIAELERQLSEARKGKP